MCNEFQKPDVILHMILCDIIHECCDMVLDYETPPFSAMRLIK